MSSVIVLLLFTALFSPSLVLTQTTETAQLHIVDDAFGGMHRNGATFHGSADISGSVTEFTIDCTVSMQGCVLVDDEQSTSFYFTEVSGTTTYTIGGGPNSGIVACGPSFSPDSAVCTRSTTDADGNPVNSTSSIDSGYYTVYLTSLADDAASAIGATMSSVTPSIVTATPAPSPPYPSPSQTKSSAITSPATNPGGSGSDGEGLSHSGKIGVGVGVALGAVFAAVVGVFGWKKWRARRNPEYSPPELYFGAVEHGGTWSKGEAARIGSGGAAEITKGSLR